MPKFPEFRYGLFNPLPLALAHYQHELVHCLTLGGGVLVETTAAPSVEVGAHWARKARRTGELVAARRHASRADHHTIVCWPAFGLLEPTAWRSRRNDCGQHFVIVHDPLPLRRQHGLGRLSAYAGRAGGRRVSVVVHTPAAKDVVEGFGWKRVLVAPHPIRAQNEGAANGEMLPRPGSRGDVLVCGQWKPARDAALLARLGPKLRAVGYTPVIAGRGWPAIDGWEIEEGFLSEERMSQRLRQAHCLLIPYVRYFQSNVAVRAVENRTPVVGYRHPFLDLLLGQEYKGYVDGSGDTQPWVEAIERSSSITSDEMERIVFRYEVTSVRGWADAIAEGSQND